MARSSIRRVSAPVSRPRRGFIVVAALAVIVATTFGVISQSDADDAVAAFTVPAGAVRVTSARGRSSRPVPPGFIGLSLEYPAPLDYAGGDPQAINPGFIRLVHGLAPGQSPVIRIGGDSTDSTWWPVAGVARPPGSAIRSLPAGWR